MNEPSLIVGQGEDVGDLLAARLLTVALLLTGSVLISGSALAENAELEKCTCDPLPEGVPNNGAWVKNATACWSTEDRGRQWCDITVQSLQESGAHGAVIGTLLQYQDDGAALAGVFQDQFQQFAAAYVRGEHAVPIDMGRAADVLPSILKENQSRISECVVAFRDASFGKGGFQTAAAGFRCSVGDASGWLRIEFQVGDFWLAYMLAPNVSRPATNWILMGCSFVAGALIGGFIGHFGDALAAFAVEKLWSQPPAIKIDFQAQRMCPNGKLSDIRRILDDDLLPLTNGADRLIICDTEALVTIRSQNSARSRCEVFRLPALVRRRTYHVARK